jgi:hypothetical protein
MSTKQVWKYLVEMNDEFTVEIPRGAHVLTVQAQHDHPQMWALVDPTEPLEKRRFAMSGTGFDIKDAHRVRYVGSFHLYGGAFVGHLFERVKGG